MTYPDWLKQQTPERQLVSIDFLMLCERLGHLQRTSPNCEEAEELRRTIAGHYERNGA